MSDDNQHIFQILYRLLMMQKSDRIRRFDLDAILPGGVFLVNISASILSVIIKSPGQSEDILFQRVLTETELRMLLSLLASPSWYPHEVLQASYHCTFEMLLQSVFSKPEGDLSSWNELVQKYRFHLSTAHRRGTLRAEMRSIYNALFSLRQKLEESGLKFVHAKMDIIFHLRRLSDLHNL